MKIILIDHSLTFAEAFRCCLMARTNIDVAAICETVDEALKTIREQEVDLIVVDAGIGGRGPLAVINEIHARHTNTPFILLAESKQVSMVEKAFAQGAKGVFARSEPIQTLIDHTQLIITNKSNRYLSPIFEEDFVYDADRDRYRATFETVMDRLTPRQMEVFQLLAEGLTVKQAAEKMHLSEKSVDSHKYRIMTRLDVHDRVALTRLAIREGIIDP